MNSATTGRAQRPTPPLVSDYMTASPHTIGADQSVAKAQQMMLSHQIRHLPVLDDGHLVGVVTDRDLRQAWQTDSELPVSEYMHEDVYTVRSTEPLIDVARYLSRHTIGSAVVVEDERVIGILTGVDVARALADTLGRP